MVDAQMISLNKLIISPEKTNKRNFNAEKFIGNDKIHNGFFFKQLLLYTYDYLYKQFKRLFMFMMFGELQTIIIL